MCMIILLKQIFQFVPLESKRIAIAVQQQRASESADEIALRLVKNMLQSRYNMHKKMKYRNLQIFAVKFN